MSEAPDDIEAMRAELAALRHRVGQLTGRLADSQREATRISHFARVVEESTDAIGLIDPSERIVFMNKSGRAMLGYGPGEDLSGLRMIDAVPERMRPLVFDVGRATALREGSWSGEAALLRRDGSEAPVSYALMAHRDADDALLFTSVILRDITAVKRLSDELKVAEEKLRYTLKEAPIALYTSSAANPAGLTYISEGVYRLLGYHPEQFAAEPHYWETLMHPEDAQRILTEVQMIKESGRMDYEYRILHVDGTYRWVYDQHRLVYDADGRPLETVGSVTDITERKEAEQLLLKVSTPLIPINDHVLVMPLIGRIDKARAELVMSTLLEGVARARAQAAILDVTGVERVDRDVADALLRAAHAAQLLGAEVVLTGIRPEVAHALVGLGIDLSRIITCSSLSAGLAHAMRKRG